MSASQKNHPFHLVDPSPWPFMVSMALLVAAVGGVLAMHGVDYVLFSIGLLAVFLVTGAWFFDVVKESRQKGVHTQAVQRGLKIGAILFILSELMLFFAFFWSYFNAAFDPIIYINEKFISGIWPPKHIETIDPFHLPFLNTLILLLSGTTVTWAHHALVKDKMAEFRMGLLLTIILGVVFLILQIAEYGHVNFKFSDGIYATTFYLITGLHGFHVFVGVAMLFVCFLRSFTKKDITADHHVGFETTVWYWHFVDIVWIFLFFAIYLWTH